MTLPEKNADSSAHKEYNFSSREIIKELPHFTEKGITEFFVHDRELSSDKKELKNLFSKMALYAPEVFYTIELASEALDKELVSLASQIDCSLEFYLDGKETQNGNLLFDKKLYSSKARLLNEADLVFGFKLNWALQKGDTFKAFRDRLDFALSLYPNHIEFEQFEDKEKLFPRSTNIFSSKDMDFARGMAFACRTFYSAGRAVPWFNTVINALRISPSAFFADFDEWQQCNNCSMDTGFIPEERKHEELEKMQLEFLKQKLDEKHKSHLFPCVKDLVSLHGAFSRLVEEGKESEVETSYNPDDVLSPYALNLALFAENVTMENSTVRIFNNEGIPDYKIL